MPTHHSISVTPPTTHPLAAGVTAAPDSDAGRQSASNAPTAADATRDGTGGPGAATHETVGSRSQTRTYPPLRSVEPTHTRSGSGASTLTGEAGQLAARAEIAVPHTTRTLPVRVVCQLPGPQWHLGRRHATGPACLAIGKSGLDPDLMSNPDDRMLLISTQFTLAARVDGTFDITGQYVDGPRGTPTLTLRWGIRTVAGHFLLLTGAQLRLPRIAALPAPRRGGARAPALILTLAMTDAQGEPLRGVIAADDLAWQVTSRQHLHRSAATGDPIRGAVIASTA